MVDFNYYSDISKILFELLSYYFDILPLLFHSLIQLIALQWTNLYHVIFLLYCKLSILTFLSV